MSEAEILDFLRENFARIHTAMAGMRDDIRNLQVRMRHLGAGMAEMNGRMDRIEVRMDRIERRLELVAPGRSR